MTFLIYKKKISWRIKILYYIQFQETFLVLAKFWSRNYSVCMLNAKATDDHIDDGNDEDKDSSGIVEDISSLLVFLIIDIQTTNYKE